MTTRTVERDYQLRRYIEERQRAACESNAADHRPTSQRELEAIKEQADKLYARGQTLLETVSDREKAQMRAYSEFTRTRSWSLPDELIGVRVEGRWMLLPFFLADIETARKLREILCECK